MVRLRVSCERICDVTARGSFLISKANKNAGAAAVVKLLRTASAQTTLAAGATVSVQAKVSATTRRSLLRALQRGRRVTLRFAVTAKRSRGAARGRPPRALASCAVSAIDAPGHRGTNDGRLSSPIIRPSTLAGEWR